MAVLYGITDSKQFNGSIIPRIEITINWHGDTGHRGSPELNPTMTGEFVLDLRKYGDEVYELRAKDLPQIGRSTSPVENTWSSGFWLFLREACGAKVWETFGKEHPAWDDLEAAERAIDAWFYNESFKNMRK